MGINSYELAADGSDWDETAQNQVTNALGRVTNTALYPYQSFDYIIFKISTTYYRRDGRTGIVDASSASASTLIQGAIDALNTATGGRILIKRGSYTITTTLDVSVNCMIQGEGNWGNGTALNKTAAGYIFDVTVSNVEIRDLYMDGNTRTASGIKDDGGGYLYLKNLYFNDCLDGVFLDGVIWGHIYQDLHFETCYRGIFCETTCTSFQAYCERIWVFEPTNVGCIFRNVNGVTMVNVEVMSPDSAGIHVLEAGGAGRNVFIGCIGENCGAQGLYINDAIQLEFDDCLFSVAASAGDVAAVDVDNGAIGDTANYISFLGGYYHSNLGSGDVVKLLTCREITVRGAIIRNDTVVGDNRAGVHLESSYRCTIEGNYFYGGKYGIEEVTSGENWLHPNVFRTVDTPLVGIAATSHLATMNFRFTEALNGAISGGSPWGVDVDAGTEEAITWGQLPTYVQQVFRLKIWAVATGGPIGAGGQMHLEVTFNAGGTLEDYNLAANSWNITTFDGEEADYVANKVIHWHIEDADVGSELANLAAGDSFELKAIYETGADPDGNTDAIFRVLEVDYV